jgi:cystathionine beta-lyase family protein involved in aluminum resistance
VAGHRTEIVDIQRAKGDEKRLVLYVKDVRYTLEAIEGVGAVFIDNVEELPEPDR